MSLWIRAGCQTELKAFKNISTRSIHSFDNLFFKFNVSLSLVTGELLQKTVDVSNVPTLLTYFTNYITNIYRYLKKLPGN